MQPKLQTILFFTLLICVQISITTSLKIKSQIHSRIQTKNTTIAPVPATNATAPATVPATNATAPATAAPTAAAPTAAAPLSAKSLEKKTKKQNNHHHHSKESKEQTKYDVRSFKKSDTENADTDDHDLQYNVHHEVPKNLTSLNDKVRDRFTLAHHRLDEINDLKKENEEMKVIRKLPSKPMGIDSIGVLNFKLRHISKQSQAFNISSVAEFEYAFNKARYLKTAAVEVNGQKYKIRQIGDTFFYGALVGKGGIGLYSHSFKSDYILIVTHNQDMSLFDFARYFEHLKHQFEDNADKLRTIYVNDHNEERVDAMKTRLKADKHLYDKTH